MFNNRKFKRLLARSNTLTTAVWKSARIDVKTANIESMTLRKMPKMAEMKFSTENVTEIIVTISTS